MGAIAVELSIGRDGSETGRWTHEAFFALYYEILKEHADARDRGETAEML